jgi:hypothetical protein
MKSFLTILSLAFLTIAARAQFIGAQSFIYGEHRGSWSEGGSNGLAVVTFWNGGTVCVERYVSTNALPQDRLEKSCGPYTEKNGQRTVTFQTERRSYSGTARVGVVRLAYKNFLSGSTGTVTCDPLP